jgi:hypothetical protein
LIVNVGMFWPACQQACALPDMPSKPPIMRDDRVSCEPLGVTTRAASAVRSRTLWRLYSENTLLPGASAPPQDLAAALRSLEAFWQLEAWATLMGTLEGGAEMAGQHTLLIDTEKMYAPGSTLDQVTNLLDDRTLAYFWSRRSPLSSGAESLWCWGDISSAAP